MRQKLNVVVAIDLFFLLLLIASSLCTGLLSTVLFYLAYALPIATGLLWLSRRKEFGGVDLLPKRRAEDRLLSTLPFAAPTLLCVLLLSYLVTFLLGLFGKTDTTEITEGLGEALLLHALVPAVAEELLFRFLPLRILAGEEKRSAVFYTALLFAGVHCNLFQIPYAFVAGILFAALDLVSGSILPSLILHLVNNVFGVLTFKFPGIDLVYLCVLAVLTVISLVYLFKRKTLIRRFWWLFDRKCKLLLSPEVFILFLFTLYVAITAIL